MNEFEILLRLAIIGKLSTTDTAIRNRVSRLIEMAHPSIRPGLAIIVLSKAPRLVIQRAVDAW